MPLEIPSSDHTSFHRTHSDIGLDTRGSPGLGRVGLGCTSYLGTVAGEQSLSTPFPTGALTASETQEDVGLDSCLSEASLACGRDLFPG